MGEKKIKNSAPRHVTDELIQKMLSDLRKEAAEKIYDQLQQRLRDDPDLEEDKWEEEQHNELIREQKKKGSIFLVIVCFRI
jgi:hypothetical protein